MREIDKFTIIAEDFNIPLSIIDRIKQNNISNDIENSNNKIRKLYLKGIKDIAFNVENCFKH